jgi:hypothetical protein|eukprot:COSAG06_NODE_25_length_32611_cov_10.451160_21_plen_653_part_00
MPISPRAASLAATTTDAVLNGLIGGSVDPSSPEGMERARYLARLASLNLERIKAEPQVLGKEYEAVNGQIEEFAFTHYRPFVETARCMGTIHTQLATMHTHLSDVHDTLPGLSASATQFQDDAKQVIERRNIVANALSHHAQLTEILEIPKLMDTLVRTEAFEEALELANYVARLKARHPNARVIGDIAAEVERSCAVMAAMLLRLLRGEVQLPDCLRFVSYIRRLRRFDEGELRWHFLACRDCWFERRNQWSPGSAVSPRAGDAQLVSDRANSLAADDGEQGQQGGGGAGAEEDAYELLMRLADNLRLHGFGIITQYRAIFTEDSGDSDGAAGGGWEGGGGLLYSWAMEKLSTLLVALEALLPQITTGARLSSLLSQVMYAGAALGRAGVEFRPLLPPLFEPALLSVFKTRLGRASEMFAESLESFQWMRFNSHAALSAGAAVAADTAGAPEVGARKAAPNMEDVIQLPPLAIFLNGMLDALNDIRGCAPTNMVRDAAQALQMTLNDASAQILASREDGGELWADFCEVYATQLIPHIVTCFEKLFRGSDRRVTWEARGGALLAIEGLKKPLKAVLEEAIAARIAEEQKQALALAKPAAPPPSAAEKAAEPEAEPEAGGAGAGEAAPAVAQAMTPAVAPAPAVVPAPAPAP